MCTGNGKPLRRRLPLWKRGLFSLAAVGLTLVLLEVLARLLTPWTLASMHAAQDSLAVSGRGGGAAQEVLHPYLGWTLNPETDPGITVNGELIPVNRWGLYDQRDSIQARSGERLIIGVLGGSVAQDFSFRGESRLAERLAADPRFAGRELVVMHLAASGYRQPQQLILLNYLYSLGAEFDYVINIDGFNDVVLANTDHLKLGIHFTYPYNWHVRLQDVVDPRETSVSYRLMGIRAGRQALAIAAARSPLRSSMLYNVIWKVRDERLLQLINRLGMEIVENNQVLGRGYPISGPRSEFESQAAARAAVVDFWKHCSWQMAVLCASRGTQYLHFLQPNQYVPNSKRLTEEELEDSFDSRHAFRFAVEENYPRMIREQGWFDDHGVRFVDLTEIFRDESRTIYRDWCCHVNQLGNDLIAEAVAKAMLSLPAE